MTLFSPFGRYRYIRLPYQMAPEGDMFQKKIDELLNGKPNVFIIADDILIVHLNEQGKYHDATLDKVLGIIRQET